MSQIKLVVYQWTDLIKTLLAMYFGQKNILYRGRNSAGILIIGIVVSFFYHWLGAGGWFLVAPIAKNINRPLGSVRAKKRARTQRTILPRRLVFHFTIPSYKSRNSLMLMPTHFSESRFEKTLRPDLLSARAKHAPRSTEAPPASKLPRH